jgi:type IV pilus assembly protein PilP
MSSKFPVLATLLLAVTLVTPACGSDDEEAGTGFGLGADAEKGSSESGESEGGPAANAALLEDSGPIVFSDDDFAELDIQNRDPFRSYAKAFKAQSASPAQRRVLLPSTSLDEMSLIAIVTGIETPRAMLTDTSQVGHVVRRGDYIGRPEVVQTGGSEGMPVTLNWRVDRIRAGSVVLTREDPTAPDKPPLTRVMPLHEGGEAPQFATP